LEIVDYDIFEEVPNFTDKFDVPGNFFFRGVEFVEEFVYGVVNEVLTGDGFWVHIMVSH